MALFSFQKTGTCATLRNSKIPWTPPPPQRKRDPVAVHTFRLKCVLKKPTTQTGITSAHFSFNNPSTEYETESKYSTYFILILQWRTKFLGQLTRSALIFPPFPLTPPSKVVVCAPLYTLPCPTSVSSSQHCLEGGRGGPVAVSKWLKKCIFCYI